MNILSRLVGLMYCAKILLALSSEAVHEIVAAYCGEVERAILGMEVAVDGWLANS